ncbi:hypothetical protein CVT24_004247 [Panaeolus cyanescens]|uniref:Uncharacterized protein n=1 Tax=Panaeolus cyanescens TaxID=181874 RepID=A0A409VA84_9AGAR|nr:hypothetical protein CVT24_004247 [Panaeolus cyanescens]
MLDECTPHHDWFNTMLTYGLCVGLIVSYLPQHLRIILTKSSEGLSPVFLLLGTGSAIAAFFNMITLQAPLVKCCNKVTFGECAEMTAGVLQLGIQWFCFSMVFVLFMKYYPERLKHVELNIEEDGTQPPIHVEIPVRSEEWSLSIVLAWTTVAAFCFVAITTMYLLWGEIPTPHQETPPKQAAWATFLGVSAAMLATVQYAPQIIHTYRMKLVGALSIPMMLIQTPGGILMVTSIALRPGTNWTSWITFLVAAILQGGLLVMCLAWKVRQRKLHIDDFGQPLDGQSPQRVEIRVDTESVETVTPHQHSITIHGAQHFTASSQSDFMIELNPLAFLQFRNHTHMQTRRLPSLPSLHHRPLKEDGVRGLDDDVTFTFAFFVFPHSTRLSCYLFGVPVIFCISDTLISFQQQFAISGA